MKKKSWTGGFCGYDMCDMINPADDCVLTFSLN